MNRKVAGWIAAPAALALIVAFSAQAQQGRKGHRVSKGTILNQLPQDKEMLYHQTMRSLRDNNQQGFEQARALHEELVNILKAKTFDETAFKRKSDEVFELRNKRREAMQNAMIDLAKQFNQEERAVLSQILPGPRPDKGGRGGMGKPRGGRNQ